jgi:hypothetical protein
MSQVGCIAQPVIFMYFIRAGCSCDDHRVIWLLVFVLVAIPVSCAHDEDACTAEYFFCSALLGLINGLLGCWLCMMAMDGCDCCCDCCCELLMN